MSKENRKAQMKEIRRIMQKQKEKLKIVCGDLNSDPSEELMSTTMKNWRDLLPEDNTFPSNNNALKLDYILTKKNADVEVIHSFFLCDYGITDHCACVVDIVIP
jgi:endonuclease/exonuclease/phosphatase family metal-dependent hydrolase